MAGRGKKGGNYKYGYQGSEKDNDISGDGNSYTTEFRQLDPRLGRWFTPDPVFQPHQSPYNSMDGNPVNFSDKQGLSTGTGDKKWWQFWKKDESETLSQENDLTVENKPKTMAFDQSENVVAGAEKTVDGINYRLEEEIDEDSGVISKIWIERKPKEPAKIKEEVIEQTHFELEENKRRWKNLFKPIKGEFKVDSKCSEVTIDTKSDKWNCNKKPDIFFKTYAACLRFINSNSISLGVL